jgi:hypothetical protein
MLWFSRSGCATTIVLRSADRALAKGKVGRREDSCCGETPRHLSETDASLRQAALTL